MKIFFIIMISVVILISGCVSELSKDDKIQVMNAADSAIKNGVQECDVFSNDNLREACINEFNKRVSERNVKIDYLKEAVESKDETKCELAENSEFCKEMYSAMLIFMNGKDISYCDIMSGPAKTDCEDVYYIYKAVTEDVSYCEQVKDIGMKKGCIG